MIKQVKDGNVLTPQGFKTDGVHAGLRYAKNDIGVILQICLHLSAAVYTKNIVQAAPIAVTKESILKKESYMELLSIVVVLMRLQANKD